MAGRHGYYFFIFASYSDTDADATFVNQDNFLITSDEDVKRFDIGSALVNVLIELTPNRGINLSANVGDDVSYYLAGVRYSFQRF